MVVGRMRWDEMSLYIRNLSQFVFRFQKVSHAST